MFDVDIKVDYIQVFYQNNYLETVNITKIEKDTDRDFYMSAMEAMEYGLIDEVIETKKGIKKGKK